MESGSACLWPTGRGHAPEGVEDLRARYTRNHLHRERSRLPGLEGLHDLLVLVRMVRAAMCRAPNRSSLTEMLLGQVKAARHGLTSVSNIKRKAKGPSAVDIGVDRRAEDDDQRISRNHPRVHYVPAIVFRTAVRATINTNRRVSTRNSDRDDKRDVYDLRFGDDENRKIIEAVEASK